MKNITRVIIALISVTIFANFFFFRMQTPLSTGLFFLGICIYCLAIAEHRHKSMWVLAITALYGAAVLWTRAAHFIQIQSMVGMLVVIASLWYASISESESFGSFTAVFLSPFFAWLTYIKRAFILIRPSTLIAGYKRGILLFSDREKHSRNISTLIGLAIALPVMLILVIMFASADPIYYSYLKNIISPEFVQELPVRIILSLLLFGAVIPFVFPRIRRIFMSPGNALGKLQMTRELTIVMSVVALVIASFIIIQWPYVFANVKAETDLSRFGVATYAEYVKKGFIELLRVSAFIYALLWLGLTALRQRVENKSKALSILQWIVMSEFFVILLSIARRVYLYQMYHGLTLIRIYGSFFLLWLACMAVTLAGRHISHKVRFGFIEGIVTILLFVVLGMWNVEHFIVTNPPTVNKRVDYVYLARMSADGVDGWIKAYTHAKQIIEKYSSTSGELDKNARREIAYAEYIIRHMTYQQYDYMNKYASPSEMKAYITAIADFQIGRLEKERSEIAKFKIMRPEETWMRERPAEITQIEQNIEKIKTQSLTDSTLIEPDGAAYSDITVDGWQNLQTFGPVSTPMLLSFYTSYNNVSGPNSAQMPGTIAERYAKITALDRLFAQNASDIHAFQIMKESIPLDELHSLQVKYFDLSTRIGKQNARDYEADISLDRPTLVNKPYEVNSPRSF